MPLNDPQHFSPESQQSTALPPAESVSAHRGRPKKYATEEERRKAKNEAKRARRRQQATVDAKVTVKNDDYDWRARNNAREEEKRKEREQERVLAQFRNDFGNQEVGGNDVRSAADVIVDYLTTDNNYNAYKTASTSEKRRMIGEMQEEMAKLGMDAATESFDSVSAFITRIVRDCSRAYALENHTGEGLSSDDAMWVDVQRGRGRCSKDEPILEAFIRLKYPLWSLMKDVLSKRPAFNPLDVFDSGATVENADDVLTAKEGTPADDMPEGGFTEVNRPGKGDPDASMTQLASGVAAGVKRRASETSAVENPPPAKNAPRPRKYTYTPQPKVKPGGSAMAEILKIQQARDKQAEAIQLHQEALDDSWLELEMRKDMREERLEAMQSERMEWEFEDRERRWKREEEDDQRRAKLDQWAKEDRETKRQSAAAQEAREAREEERREKRFRQEMDERRIRMWMSLRAEVGAEAAGRIVWGDAWGRERDRLPVGLTATVTDNSN